MKEAGRKAVIRRAPMKGIQSHAPSPHPPLPGHQKVSISATTHIWHNEPTHHYPDNSHRPQKLCAKLTLPSRGLTSLRCFSQQQEAASHIRQISIHCFFQFGLWSIALGRMCAFHQEHVITPQNLADVPTHLGQDKLWSCPGFLSPSTLHGVLASLP